MIITITSSAFIKKHSLLSSSSIQTAVKQLLEKEIITSENNIYQVYDRFFWFVVDYSFWNGLSNWLAEFINSTPSAALYNPTDWF